MCTLKTTLQAINPIGATREDYQAQNVAAWDGDTERSLDAQSEAQPQKTQVPPPSTKRCPSISFEDK